MRKLILVIAIAAMTAVGVFAQQAASFGVKNFLSGEVSFFGAGARYEYMLNDKMSIGPNVYWSTLFFSADFEVGGSFRFYPWGKNILGLFFGAGLGFHINWGWGNFPYTYDNYDRYGYYGYYGSRTHRIVSGSDPYGMTIGAAISPEVGLKIDFGKPGGFFIQPGIKVPITFGAGIPLIGGAFGGVYDYEVKGSFHVGFGIVPYCGLGFAF